MSFGEKIEWTLNKKGDEILTPKQQCNVKQSKA